MQKLRLEARRLIARDAELDRRYRLMLTVPGIGETSALQILGELVVFSDAADARQWVDVSTATLSNQPTGPQRSEEEALEAVYFALLNGFIFLLLILPPCGGAFGLTTEGTVNRERPTAANHQYSGNGQGQQVKFKTLAPLLSRPVHKQPIWQMDHQHGHRHVAGNAQRGHST
jgi:hypothetical protein